MTTQQDTPESTLRLGDAPKALWVGLIVGLVAFVVKLSLSSISSTNGVMTSCSYFDPFALFAAAVCLICGIVSAVKRVRRPGRYPFAAWLVHLLSGVLVLLAIVHALRAFGIVGGIC